MFAGLVVLGTLLAEEEGAAYRFGEFLGGLLCIGGIIGVVMFVSWMMNPPRRKGRGGSRRPGQEPDEEGRG
jgi:hypothetical protein